MKSVETTVADAVSRFRGAKAVYEHVAREHPDLAEIEVRAAITRHHKQWHAAVMAARVLFDEDVFDYPTVAAAIRREMPDLAAAYVSAVGNNAASRHTLVGKIPVHLDELEGGHYENDQTILASLDEDDIDHDWEQFAPVESHKWWESCRRQFDEEIASAAA